MRDDRNRQLEALADLDRLEGDQPDGSAGWLLVTFTEGTYPTVAGSVYATHPVWLDADDTEGATPSFAADTGRTIYALNIGTTIPASGSYVIGTAVGGRTCFRWDS